MLGMYEEKELIKDNIKVVLVNLNEGFYGDYNADNPKDKNFLRFEVYMNNQGEWQEVEDASYCTCLEADADEEKMDKCLEILMNEFYDVLHDNPEISVKKLGERLSWIS